MVRILQNKTLHMIETKEVIPLEMSRGSICGDGSTHPLLDGGDG